MEQKKRVWIFLILLLTLTFVPMAAFAEIGDGYGQCEHHPEHVACGFEGTGTCTYLCEICKAKTQTLIDTLPTMEEITKMSQSEKEAMKGNELEAVHEAGLNLSQAARDELDWSKYDEACFIVYMPEGYFGAVVTKTFSMESASNPVPQFIFVNEREEAQTLVLADGAEQALLCVDEYGNSGYFYLPEGTYTVQELVDGNWVLSMKVEEEDATDCTFTGIGGNVYGIELLNSPVLKKPTISGTYTYNFGEQTAILNDVYESFMTVSGDKREDAGRQNITVSLKEGYTWEDGSTEDVILEFKIEKLSKKPTIQSIAAQEYTGNEIKPEIAVSIDGHSLTKGEDYTVEYENNINAGTATVKIMPTPEGNFSWDAVEENFTITPMKILPVIVDIADVTFNQEEHKPKLTVTTGSSIVLNQNDYTANYKDNKYVGIATVEVCAKKDGNYIWAKPIVKTFQIQAAISQLTANPVNVTDRENTPVTLKVNGEGLNLSDFVEINLPAYQDITFAIVDDGKTGATLDLDGMTLKDATAAGMVTIRASFSGKDFNDDANLDYAAAEDLIFYVNVKESSSSHGSSSSGSSSNTFRVLFDTNGGSTITGQTVRKNGMAMEPTEPTKTGFEFAGWYTDRDFTQKYDFATKVSKNITLYAKWLEIENWNNLFDDVKKTDWYYAPVQYAYKQGLLKGTSDRTFSPNDYITRGMFVTVLYRIEGEPAVHTDNPFLDVKTRDYYANAVVWAWQNEIVKGYSETEFAPDRAITREQIAVMLYRYAQYKGYDVSVEKDTNILSYIDYEDLTKSMIESMRYAVGSGFLNGKTDTTLNPKDFATRAEIAAIFQRFLSSQK